MNAAIRLDSTTIRMYADKVSEVFWRSNFWASLMRKNAIFAAGGRYASFGEERIPWQQFRAYSALPALMPEKHDLGRQVDALAQIIRAKVLAVLHRFCKAALFGPQGIAAMRATSPCRRWDGNSVTNLCYVLENNPEEEKRTCIIGSRRWARKVGYTEIDGLQIIGIAGWPQNLWCAFSKSSVRTFFLTSQSVDVMLDGDKLQCAVYGCWHFDKPDDWLFLEAH